MSDLRHWFTKQLVNWVFVQVHNVQFIRKNNWPYKPTSDQTSCEVSERDSLKANAAQWCCMSIM